MLSKKYLTIKQALTGVSKVGFLHDKLIVFAKMYLDIDKGFRFSYIPEENGEVEFMDALRRYYQSKFTFFDIGAHFGNYTDRIVKRFCNYEGHLFDLSPDTLKQCIAQHGGDKNLSINNMAVTDFVGEVEYRYYPGTDEQTGISGVGPYKNHDFQLLKSKAVTGDHYCAENKIDHINLLKIDTEGYDLHVLRGFETMLAKGKIDIIQFEYNIKSGETHSMLGDFYALLEKHGYILGPLRQEGVLFRSYDYTLNDFNYGPNYIACRPEFRNFLADFSTSEAAYAPKIEAEREKLGYWGRDQNAPRYSVCVCNYNMADTLERSMGSVARQLDPKLYEIVILDDGSSDDSLKILEKLSKEYPHLRYISLPRDPKRKLGATRNLSIRAARGEYVLLHIDADDEWEPYLMDLVKLFHNLEKTHGKDMLLAGHQTGIAKRDFLLSYGPYANLYRYEDRNMMMRLAKENRLMFLDYRVYRTRLGRPMKRRIIKTWQDVGSQLMYEMRQDIPKAPFIWKTLISPITGSPYSSFKICALRAAMVLPIYIASRFQPPIKNPITWEQLYEYHTAKRGTYPEVMTRLGGDPDMSFLSKEANDIYSHQVKNAGFRSSK